MTQVLETPFDVRDYECDLQGIVNNAVYQNYLEHSRHLFLKKCGIDFAEITAQGIHLVVAEAHLKYKKSLVSGDSFTVHTTVHPKSSVSFTFVQKIIHRDGSLCLSAELIGVSVDAKTSKLMRLSPEIIQKLGLSAS
jgi:acyl-CoA thioester hydrolase